MNIIVEPIEFSLRSKSKTTFEKVKFGKILDTYLRIHNIYAQVFQSRLIVESVNQARSQLVRYAHSDNN